MLPVDQRADDEAPSAAALPEMREGLGRVLDVEAVGREEGEPSFYARAREALANGTGTFSGLPIEHFEQGWALIPFCGTKPHYWRPYDTGNRLYPHAQWYLPLCQSGVIGRTSEQVPALGVGNQQVCQHCARIAKLKRIPLPTAAERNTWASTFDVAKVT